MHIHTYMQEHYYHQHAHNIHTHTHTYRDLVLVDGRLVAGRFVVKKEKKQDEKYVFPRGYSLINGQM
jgi:hypothetical protein